MVNLLELPFVLQDPQVVKGIGADLSAAEEERVRIAARQMGDFLRPLATAQEPAALEVLLSDAALRYWQILMPVLDVLLDGPEKTKLFQQQVTDAIAGIKETIRRRADLLGEEATEQLLGALSSQEELSAWAFEGLQQGGATAQRVAAMVSLVAEPAMKGQLCIVAAAGILSEKIPDWTRESLLLLAASADDYLTEVEDKFLEIRSATLGPDRETAPERVTHDDFRHLLRL